MNLDKYLSAILIFACFYSCTNIHENKNPRYQKNSISPHQESYTLQISDTIRLPLDHYSIPLNRSINTFSLNNATYYSFINKFKGTIYIYKYNRESLVKKIPIDQEILEKYNNITGLHIVSFDSIFVFDYNKTSYLLLNQKGKLQSTLAPPDSSFKSVKYPPSPKGWMTMPIVKRGSQLITAGYKTGEMTDETKRNRPITLIFDSQTEETHFQGYYPEVYREGNWGGSLYRRFYYTYNPFEDLFIYSFPADHHVSVSQHTPQNTFKKYYAGSKIIPSINSMGQSKYFSFSKMDRRKHFAKNYSYGPIYFDPYRNRYYRIAEKKIKDFKDDLYKEKLLIGLNSDFKKIFEFDLSNYFQNKIYTYGIFVTQEGLNVQVLDGNEDQITIKVVTFYDDEN
ncbi:DUF4221 family protein [Fodinibius halophilus]|uniref:DUF4221 family protein n=1 Tax=Fodinibius halophilus TaxID=1736908 RepID=A0A6M1THJ2_9BACT|nr:DUF4221 family protein [Fodinibius halophilus]NGP88120.1 DUF4221 family protein [Fodinibius halophilus]